MQPVIDPLIFYYTEVCHKLSVIATVGAVLLTVLLLGRIIFSYIEGESKKGIHSIAIAWFLMVVLSVAIPSKDTLVKVFIAREITYDRIEKIVKGSKTVKDNLKQDVLDIIEKINQRGAEKDEQ